jgi:ABC-2 type transport system ATP-binding protein
VIQVRGLSKHYRVHRRPPGLAAAFRSLFRRKYEVVRAVDGIDFSVGEGERVGFLGPNGAGKTTTLKILSGLLHPTAGEVDVAGFVPRRRETEFLKTITLVMGQKQQLLWDLPPAETFAMNRAIYDIPRARFEETLRELVDLLELGDLVDKPTRQLSLGERMRCELAAALLHRPRVLFLDEPTIGLDVSAQATVRGFVRAYNERFGATILLTSHYMEDVAQLCPRVIVIDRGRIIYDGDLRALAREIRPDKRIVVSLANGGAAAADLARLAPVVAREEGQATFQVPAEEVSATVARILAALPVLDLTVSDPPLEEVLSELFRSSRKAGEAAAAPSAAHSPFTFDHSHAGPLAGRSTRRCSRANFAAARMERSESRLQQRAASIRPMTASAAAVIRFESPRSFPRSGVDPVARATKVPVPIAAPQAPCVPQKPPERGSERRRASAIRSAFSLPSPRTFEKAARRTAGTRKWCSGPWSFTAGWRMSRSARATGSRSSLATHAFSMTSFAGAE